MSPEERKRLCAKVDLVKLISRYTELAPGKIGVVGDCPIHPDTAKKLVVSKEAARWHCFGQCATGGDALTFLSLMLDISLEQAADQLETWADD